MKTALFSRLNALLMVVLLLPATMATASPLLYTQAPLTACHGYWTATTDAANPQYTLVRFYSDQHQELYQQRIPVCLALGTGTAAAHRNARILDKALRQVQRTQAAPILTLKFGEASQAQPLLTLR